MTKSISSRKVEAGGRRGFSLIEILTTVALLSFIILGLVAMFNQTRRAFTSSMTQVDVLESGRSAADFMGREMEQMAASTPVSAPPIGLFMTNFYAGTPSSYAPLTQALADPTDIRTNDLMQVYFLTFNNQQWSGIGYKLTNYSSGIGTLFRYSSNNISYTSNSALYYMPAAFMNIATPGANFSRVIDGVVDFRVRVYDTNGYLITARTNSTSSIIVNTNVNTGEYTQQMFAGAALPAYVEIELGVLEDRALAQYKALSAGGVPAGPGSVPWNYLSNHVGQVHIFRQRIPIRNVNPAAYP